jgi:hypothetical protein
MALRLLVPAAALAALALPLSAEAATLSVDRPCYPVGTAMVVSGGGFTPGAPVRLSYSNAGPAPVNATADGAGNFAQAIPAPAISRSEQTITVGATDGANTGSAPARVTKTELTVRPSRRVSPTRRVLYRVRGFPGLRRVYMHYVYRKRRRATVRLTRPRGRCGVFSRRMRMLPVRRLRFGRWTIQVDASRRYSPLTTPRLTGRLTIFRTVRR